MAIIQKIGQLLNTPIGLQTGKTVRNVSNPFAPSTFKGNVLTADVYEKTAARKLTYSAFVGSIGDAFPTFRKAVESVVAFGNRVKTEVKDTFRRLSEIGNTEITIDFGKAGKAVKEAFNNMQDKFSVQQLKKQDVKSLETMWKEMTMLNVAA